MTGVQCVTYWIRSLDTLPGQLCQGLGHILGRVGADLREHHLVVLHMICTESQETGGQ